MIPPRFEGDLARSWPLAAWADVPVLVAVSGGADSVALLRGLTALKQNGRGQLIVAHFNHRLRGAESDADEQFVSCLARDLDLQFEVGRMEAGGLDTCPDGLEQAARSQRYRFLKGGAERLGARYVACAHTADDQIETILHRILRGTGIAGLAGIPRCRRLSHAVTLIRPLLDFRRSELVEYLEALGQPYREDSSNQDQRFTRNRIRHDLLPHLAEQYNPSVGEALRRLGLLAGEAQDVVDELVRTLIREAVDESGGWVLIRRDKTDDQAEYLVRELLIAIWQQHDWPLQSMGFEQWNLLLQMLRFRPGGEEITPGTRTFPGRIQATCDPEGLWLKPL